MSAVRLNARALVATGFALVALVATSFPARAAEQAPGRGAAVVLPEGESSEEGLFGSCVDVIVKGEAHGAVSLAGDVHVSGRVKGDASAFGGRVLVLPGGVVTGNAFALFGAVEVAEGGIVEGEVWSLAPRDSAHRGYLALAYSKPSLLARFLFLLCWFGSALLGAFLAPKTVAQGASELMRHPGRLLGIGLLVSLSLLLSSVLAVALIQVFIGIPLLILLLLVWVCLVALSSAAVFHAVGERVTERLGQGNVTGYAVLLAGALVLGLLHFLPLIGELSFFLTCAVGAGATLATRFGHRKPASLPHA